MGDLKAGWGTEASRESGKEEVPSIFHLEKGNNFDFNTQILNLKNEAGIEFESKFLSMLQFMIINQDSMDPGLVKDLGQCKLNLKPALERC